MHGILDLILNKHLYTERLLSFSIVACGSHWLTMEIVVTTYLLQPYITAVAAAKVVALCCVLMYVVVTALGL